MNRESDLGLGRNPAPTVNITKGPADAPAVSAEVRIPPTIGRVVLYTPANNVSDSVFASHGGQKHAAIVAYVWSDFLVNLAVFDHNGGLHARTSVPLIQPHEPKPEDGGFCSWMPYQVGQAKKDAK
jgi:hypothetical protein